MGYQKVKDWNLDSSHQCCQHGRGQAPNGQERLHSVVASRSIAWSVWLVNMFPNRKLSPHTFVKYSYGYNYRVD